MSKEKTLTGKVPRERIGMLELPRLLAETLATFRALEDLSGVVSDALDELGIAGAVASSVLKPTDPAARLCGPALTVLNRPLAVPVAKAVQANVSRLGEIEAHNLAAGGDVLVIQGVEGISSMGAISASLGKRQGEAGAVVDGAVRDIAHSRGIGYPVWSKGASPITGKWRIETVAINVPVAICGIPVKPSWPTKWACASCPTSARRRCSPPCSASSSTKRTACRRSPPASRCRISPKRPGNKLGSGPNYFSRK
jgi:regulator of RNase E activity RraA